MSFKKYLNEYKLAIILTLLSYFLIFSLLMIFKINIALIILCELILIVLMLAILIGEYFRRRKFYNELLNNTNRLDKKYLVLETINKPNYYEGELIYQTLYEIDKSMIEHIKEYEDSIDEFKDYVELWIHEVKIPLMSLMLKCHNNKDKIDRTFEEQIRKLDNYIEQILYYVRSEEANKDFSIKNVELKKVISRTALRNKDDLLENKINLMVENVDFVVLSDSKWLEFIINQIINNSIKYRNNKVENYIKITAKEDIDKIVLSILDNGIGIEKADLSRVFEKTFTGSNGRIVTSSTGMGLYIVNKLCQKLGHVISIDSEINNYTCVNITFFKNDFYNLQS